MQKFNFLKELTELFSCQNANLNDNRFAFLAATGKCELAIRDEIAYQFQCKYLDRQKQSGFPPRDFIVAREWGKRYDLAILKKPTGQAEYIPECVVEFKAVATADKIQNYISKIYKDYKKLVDDYKISDAKKYVVLVVMLPNKKFDDDDPVIKVVRKYFRGINRQFQGNKKPKIQKCFKDWKNFLNEKQIKTPGMNGMKKIVINAGMYTDVKIKLALFIAGPLIKP